MKRFFTKRSGRLAALMLALAVVFTSFAWVMPVNAADTADMAKANVKWDLKNKKTVKFKTTWSEVGVKKHTVKMTGFKVKKAKKKGYKQCTFTLTFNRDIKPSNKQISKMGAISSMGSIYGGNFWFTVADYQTGECLEVPNDKDVTVKSKWTYSKYTKKKAKDGSWIRFAKKATAKVTIVYPATYKDLVIGAGGYTCASKLVEAQDAEEYEGDVWEDFATGKFYELDEPVTNLFFRGGDSFSDADYLYSKTDKAFAHFMRIKK